MKKILLLLILLFLISNSNSQFIKNYGFKIGVLNNTLYMGSTPLTDVWAYDLGIFIEIPVFKKLSFVVELNFNEKGTSTPYLYPNFIINNRFRYLTLSGLTKYNFAEKEIDFYGIIGLRTDMMINNYYSGNYYDANIIKLRNFNFELGGTIGFGLGINPGPFLEFQYIPNFTSVYKVTFMGNQSSYRNSSILLLCGINFK